MDAIGSLSKTTINLITRCWVGGLSTATDIPITADNSRFGIPVIRLGILVGHKETWRLVRLVGPSNVSYMLLSTRLVEVD